MLVVESDAAVVPAIDAFASIGQIQNSQVRRPELKSSLKPLFFISQCTGLTFFGHADGKKFKLIICYRIVLFLLLILCLIHELPTIKFWISNMRGLHAMLACVETWYRWTILFANFLLNICNNTRISSTVSHLTEMLIVLEEPVYQRIHRFQILIISLCLILIICFMTIGHDEMWTNINYKWYTSTIYIFTEFYIAFSNVQFVGILYAIREYFKTINEHLRNCNFNANRTFLFVVDGSHKQNVPFDVVKFREIHLNLSCISLKLNQCYTVQILLFLVLCMIEITYSLRSCMIFIVTSDNKTERNDWVQKPWLEMALTIFWGGYYIVILLELVTFCDLTASESRQTSVVVHELINKVQDKSVERQLQIFSLQLMNHAASFTAGRFFPLDFALLHSIIGAITTYLVIIITFRE